MTENGSGEKLKQKEVSGKITGGESTTTIAVSFTKKELEVLALVCRQKTSREISQILGISPRTVEGYREKMREKAGAKNQIGLILYAIKHGLFILD